MKRITDYSIFLLLSLLLISACKDDDAPSLDMSKVGQVEDFVDERDGHVYRCVRIGDQIWMMDNLAYQLEQGSYGGCFTWEEPILKLSQVEIPNETFIETCTNVLNDPKHDWSVEQPNMDIASVSRYLQFMELYGWGASQVLGIVARYTVFYNTLNEELNKIRLQYMGPLAKSHLESQDKLNGQYSGKYGLLYSLDAARKAVPEGWRIPSDKDWMKMEAALGMSASELETINAWRGNGCGSFLKEGGGALFEAKMGGCNAWSGSGNQYIHQQECAYFWTNEEWETISTSSDTNSGSNGDSDAKTQEIIKEGIIRQVAIYSSMIWRGTTRINNKYRPVCYSVRCVKDAK